MSKTYNVAVLVGSLRKASINRKLALALASLRFDVIFLAPRQWPRHVMNAFSDNAD